MLICHLLIATILPFTGKISVKRVLGVVQNTHIVERTNNLVKIVLHYCSACSSVLSLRGPIKRLRILRLALVYDRNFLDDLKDAVVCF